MSELRRLRRERIFAAYGPRGRKLPAGVPFGEFPAGPACYFGLDFPVRKSVHAGAERTVGLARRVAQDQLRAGGCGN